MSIYPCGDPHGSRPNEPSPRGRASSMNGDFAIPLLLLEAANVGKMIVSSQTLAAARTLG
jgi:hypothetical protein